VVETPLPIQIPHRKGFNSMPSTEQAALALPGFLESVRVADRALLDVARTHRLRPMEAYLMLILLDEDGPVSTAQIAARIAASSSQAKQLALALQLRGLITRRDRTGLTELTSEGRQEANGLSVEVVEALQQRLSPLGTVKALEAVIA
jgi:DNA-binding MarR family transcriptional regulator